MSKKLIADQLAEQVGISKRDATRLLGDVIRIIRENLINGETVNLSGLGKFEVKKTHAYQIKNLKGEEITVPEQNRLRCYLSKTLRSEVKNSTI